jgi:hypothetical protein
MRTRRGRWALLLCCALLGLAATPAPAQHETDSDRRLRDALEEDFEVLVLRDGVLLQPRDASATPRSIEVGPDGVYLDGTPAGEDELVARLGEETAARVLELADRDVEELRRLATEAPETESAELAESEADPEVREDGGGAAPEVGEEAEEETDEEADEEAGEGEDEEPDRVRSERRVHRDTQVVIASGHTVERDEVSEDVLVVGGPLRVHGKVVGDAVAFGGPVTISGEVTGDVSSIGGPVDLESTAEVHGDVVSVGGRVHREPGAEVGGRIEEVPFRWRISGSPWSDGWFDAGDYTFDFSPFRHWMRVGWKLFWVLFLALLACIALLAARRPIERMERRIQGEPWKAGLVGLLAQVLFIPVVVLVAVVLAISIIGIPVLLLLPFALVFVALAAFLGFVAMARVAGRWLERRFGRDLGGPYVEALVGLAAIYAISLIGHALNVGPMPLRFLGVMSLVLGVLITYAAWTVGFGASILTRFGSADSWERGGGRRSLPLVPQVPAPGEGSSSMFDEPEDWSPEDDPSPQPDAPDDEPDDWRPGGDDEPGR